MKILLSWISAGLFWVTFVGGCRDTNDTAAAGSQNGIIDFRLDTLEHERFYLNQHRGKIVVLVFWATWCGPCKTELVELKALAESSPRNDVVVAAVCTDPEEIGVVKSITETLDIRYPVLLDKQAAVFKRLNMSAVPTTLVIDRAGRVSFARQGFDAVILQQINKSIEHLRIAEDGL